MKRAALCLRRAALGLAALTGLVWLLTGAHRGWTHTSVAVEKQDEVTGLTFREYRKRFRPGVDFLGAGLLAAGVLAGVSRVLDRGRQSR